MKILDTFHQIDNCYTNGIFNIDLWEKYANELSPSLAEKLKIDIANYDFQKGVLPLLNNVAQNRDKLNIAHQSFLSLTNGLSEKLQCILQTDLNVSIIFYLGLCNAAGWATELDGKPVVLLGAEKILELSWHNKSDMAGLIYHELGHIWHDKLRSMEIEPFRNGDLWQIYREGIAMYIEQLLIDNDMFYHQNKDGWLNWCLENKKELFRVYYDRINNYESTGEFFGDWNKYDGKSDVGYYLGCEIIKGLATKYSLTELANLKETDVCGQLQHMAK